MHSYLLDDFRDLQSLTKKLFVLFVASIPFTVPVSNILFAAFTVSFVIDRYRKKDFFMHMSGLKNSASIIIFLYFLLGLISVSYSSNFDQAVNVCVRQLPLLLAPVAVVMLRLNEKDRHTLYSVFVLVNILLIIALIGRAGYKSVFLSPSGLVFDASVLGGLSFWYSITQGGNHFFYSAFSMIQHPTYWSICLLLCVGILTGRLDTKETTSRTLIYFGLLLLVLALFLCSARIAVLWLLIYALGYSIFRLSGISKIHLIVGVVVTILVTLAFLSNPRFGVLDKLQNNIVEDQRTSSWSAAIEVIAANPLVGVGLGDTQDELNRVYSSKGLTSHLDQSLNEHNQYLNTAVALGIPGLLTLLASIIAGFFLALREKSTMKIMYILSFAFICLSENLLLRRTGIMYFAVFYSLFFVAGAHTTKS